VLTNEFAALPLNSASTDCSSQSLERPESERQKRRWAESGSSFVSVYFVTTYFDQSCDPKKIVIHNSSRCKEMTIVTMFWGVSPSDVREWDTKASATDQRVRAPRRRFGGAAGA
jgi:hypothetical protein